MTNAISSPSDSSNFTAFSGESAGSKPAHAYPDDETTTLRLLGSGRNFSGRDSYVFLPMITGFPEVSFRKFAKSSGRCHGSVPDFQMVLSPSAIAAMSTVFILGIGYARMILRSAVWANDSPPLPRLPRLRLIIPPLSA